jgi:hypothetical protein
MQYGQKSQCEVGAKESMISSEIRKKPSILLRDNRKDALRACQELARCHLLDSRI